jgi:hypothetical protein
MEAMIDDNTLMFAIRYAGTRLVGIVLAVMAAISDKNEAAAVLKP